MTKLIIKKGASHYAILSLGIAMFLLMLFFTATFLNISQDNNNGKSILLFELKDGHPSNIKELLLDELNLISPLKNSSYSYISKGDGLKSMQNELDPAVFSTLESQNPLKSIVKIEANALSDNDINKVLNLNQKLDNFVSDVKTNTIQQSNNIPFDKILKALVPFIILCLLFCIFILMGSVRGDLMLNKTDIKKAIISGVDSKLLTTDLRTNLIKSFFLASILSLFLYFLTFYLISNYLDVNFTHFSFYIFVKPIFTSLLVVLISILIIINIKVKNFLKTI